MAVGLGMQVRDERLRRRLTLAQVGERAGLSTSAVHRVESGRPAALGSYARIALALGLRPDFDLADDRRLAPPRAVDPVHAWMGEVEAGRLLAADLTVALDEPYQHYQFAGRADVVAWSLERRSLLHIENRTRFPNLQDALGSYNAKRAYLASALAERLNLRGGFSSVTHALVGLWSGEVQHAVRLRIATFRATCPDDSMAFSAWWSGDPPATGTSSTFILLDPLDRPRSRRFVDLDDAPRATARYRGYADAAAAAGGRR